jgi:hypothetical protein
LLFAAGARVPGINFVDGAVLNQAPEKRARELQSVGNALQAYKAEYDNPITPLLPRSIARLNNETIMEQRNEHRLCVDFEYPDRLVFRSSDWVMRLARGYLRRLRPAMLQERWRKPNTTNKTLKPSASRLKSLRNDRRLSSRQTIGVMSSPAPAAGADDESWTDWLSVTGNEQGCHMYLGPVYKWADTPGEMLDNLISKIRSLDFTPTVHSEHEPQYWGYENAGRDHRI